MGTKNLYKNGSNPFFFSFNLMGTGMVQNRIANVTRQEVLYFQLLIPPKRFDIFSP